LYVLYLDESGDPGVNIGATKHLVVGGAAIHEGQWESLSRKLDEFQTQKFPSLTEPVELHCHDARQGKHLFAGISQENRVIFLDDFYGLIANHPMGVVLFATTIDKEALRPGEQPYERALEDIFSRFDLFLRRQFANSNPQKGIIVIDNTTLRTRLLPLLDRWRREGTRWAANRNIIETTFFLDSKASRLVQVADFCASAVFQYYERNDTRAFNMLVRKFDREIDTGKIPGLRHITRDSSCGCLACLQRLR